jgi:hypothetical protein
MWMWKGYLNQHAKFQFESVYDYEHYIEHPGQKYNSFLKDIIPNFNWKVTPISSIPELTWQGGQGELTPHCPCSKNYEIGNYLFLTPKGPNVHTADKPVLGSVTWSYTIFRFFETFCEDASRSKLRGSTKIVFFRTYGSKVMGFWKFEEKYGQGGHVLEPTNKSWLHQPKKVGSRNKESWEKPFESFLFNLLNLASILGKVKSSIPHGAWRFYFFSNFIFSKFRVHLDLHIHRWDFSLMKKWNHKKFHKNC